MRSLWSGVSGLQSHQIAMDVEGNNIANVNTTGFKYSRANFSSLLSQTSKIATAPQGDLGGKNAMQVGLGTQVSSVTTIFKQGSIQSTDKTTDLAISGEGFFVVSPDNGDTYKYTRNGDFVFDADGNFTDSNGYIVQGWIRDEDTGEIDATEPIQSITVSNGLTTPAQASSYISLQANLNSGSNISSMAAIYTLDSFNGAIDLDEDGVLSASEIGNHDEDTGTTIFDDGEIYEKAQDFGVLYDASGDALNLQDGQGVWISYAAATYTQDVGTAAGAIVYNMTINGQTVSGTTDGIDAATNAIEIATAISIACDDVGVTASASGTEITYTNTNSSGTTANEHNLNIKVNASDATALSSKEVYTAYYYTYAEGTASPIQGVPAVDSALTARTFNSTEDLRYAMQNDAVNNVNYDSADVASVTAGETTIDFTGALTSGNLDVDINGTPISVTYATSQAATLTALAAAIESEINTNQTPSSPVTVNVVGDDIIISGNADGTTIPTITVTDIGDFTTGIPAVSIPAVSLELSSSDDNTGVEIEVNSSGQFVATNESGSYDLVFNVTAYEKASTTDAVVENEGFSDVISSIEGNLAIGTSERTTGALFAANHASSIEVYDSLGSKHTVRLEFTKESASSEDGSTWQVMASVEAPADVDGDIGSTNIKLGTISFNSDGSLNQSTLTTLSFSPNNGAESNQNISLEFGSSDAYDGLTSFDSESATSGISQDGYTGGDLDGLRVDETGTVIGSFTNGRSFGLAQVSMAKFNNDEGLESDGGNTYIQTSNSGEPVIGEANSGGRGYIQASSLEMSNVDLSRSLTQLIIVQRGFQANSKTITTSDEMLQSLLQLK